MGDFGVALISISVGGRLTKLDELGNPFDHTDRETPPATDSPFPPLTREPDSTEKQRNPLGTIALVVSVIALAVSFRTETVVLSWILLPIAFVISIVSAFLKNTSKNNGTWALVITIIGAVVSFTVSGIGSAILETSKASESDVVPEFSSPPGITRADTNAAASVPAEDNASTATRSNPLPLGTESTIGEWAVIVNSVDLDANDRVAAAYRFNDPPAEGSVYILANVTARYLGENPQGELPFLMVDYITETGNTIRSFDVSFVKPDPFNSSAPLYSGASTTGNFGFMVPNSAPGNGTFAVSMPSSDRFFYAVQ